MSGDLIIEASGEVGGEVVDSESVGIPWRWYYGFNSGIPWIVFLIVLLAPRVNRSGQVWLVLLPVGILKGIATLWVMAVQFGGSGFEPFVVFFDAILLGLGVVWILIPAVTRPRRLVTFLCSLGPLIGMVTLTCVFGLGFSDTSVQVGITAIVVTLLGLLTLFFAGLFCRKRVSGLRFFGWLVYWNVVITYAFIVIVVIFTGSFEKLLVYLYIGAIYAIALTIIVLPFAILAYCSTPFRERSVSMGLFPKVFIAAPDTAVALNDNEQENETA